MESYYELLMKELNAETPREAYKEVLRLKETIKKREDEIRVTLENWRTNIREINEYHNR